MKRKDFEELLPLLRSEDAFARLDAEKRLRDLIQRDFGFRWDDPPDARAAALARMQEWMERARKAERTLRKAAAAAAGGLAQVNLAELKGMSPEELQKHLQALLSKAGFAEGDSPGRPGCEGCARRPATVEIVVVAGGKAREVTLLCDPCAAERGEVRGA